MNSLNLKQIDGGTNIKQGDYSSIFKFELQDENYNTINHLDGETAIVRLGVYGKTYFEKKVIVSDSIIEFNIDKILENATYELEVHVSDYVFPSDNSITITIYRNLEQLLEANEFETIYNIIDEYIKKHYKNSKDSKDANYIFYQDEPSNKWIINHPLEKYPSVSVIDSTNELIDGINVKYNSNTQLEIIFDYSFSGKAILN